MIGLEVSRIAFGSSHQLKADVEAACVVKFQGAELGRTRGIVGDLVWEEHISINHFDINGLETVHNRPFYLEHLDIEVIQKGSKVLETRISLTSIDKGAQFYKLLRPDGQDHKHSKQQESSYLLLELKCENPALKEWVPSFSRCALPQVLPEQPNLHFLYASIDNRRPSLTYRFGLPLPTCGEQLVDVHKNVEWRLPTQVNSFGDNLSVTCKGNIYVTDLRVIFLPSELTFPLNRHAPVRLHPESDLPLSAAELLYLHRYTVQIPLGALRECRKGKSGEMHEAEYVLIFDTLDGNSFEFVISPASPSAYRKRNPHHLSLRAARPASKMHGSAVYSGRYVYQNPSGANTGNKYADFHFAAGLETEDIQGEVWVDRVVDFLAFECRRDEAWLVWARHWQETLQHYSSHQFSSRMLSNAKDGIKTPLSPNATTTPSKQERRATDWLQWLKSICCVTLDLDDDYQRCQVQDVYWRLSDLNAGYALCPTYPSSLVFPGSLSDEDIALAATQRSIGRLPSLVWMHAETKAPLCRSAQPLTGVSGLINKEHDKKMCLAIKRSCPTQLPLRIADARPRLNANANAMQGKGFENVAYFGGPSVASLVFLDIDNIHVMRSSLLKVKESLLERAVATNSEDVSLEDGSYATFVSSKWTNHVAAVLRGAVSVADSLTLGHPVLVHCSDGWDRTSQLSALAQVLLDPFYRTVEGLLVLINKDWASFGHKFEDRVGRGTHTSSESTSNSSSGAGTAGSMGSGGIALHTASGSHSKEISPVFVQFLDVLWQVLNQFPTQFEYSEHLLTLLVQCLYSGFFVTLRGNNEKDRMHMLLHQQRLNVELASVKAQPSSASSTAGTSFPTDILQCTSLSFYVQFLLRCPAWAALLLNPHYNTGVSATGGNMRRPQQRVAYLRPRTQAVHLGLWKEGLFGLNSNLVHVLGALGGGSDPVIHATGGSLTHGSSTSSRGYYGEAEGSLTSSAQMVETAGSEVSVTASEAAMSLAERFASVLNYQRLLALSQGLEGHQGAGGAIQTDGSVSSDPNSPPLLRSSDHSDDVIAPQPPSLKSTGSFKPPTSARPALFMRSRTDYLLRQLEIQLHSNSHKISTRYMALTFAQQQSSLHQMHPTLHTHSNSHSLLSSHETFLQHQQRLNKDYWHWLHTQYTADIRMHQHDLSVLLGHYNGDYWLVQEVQAVVRRIQRWYVACKMTRQALVAFDIVPKSYYQKYPYGSQCTMQQRKKLQRVQTHREIACVQRACYLLSAHYLQRQTQRAIAHQQSIRDFIVDGVLGPIIQGIVERDVQTELALQLASQMMQSLSPTTSQSTSSKHSSLTNSSAQRTNSQEANGSVLAADYAKLLKSSKKTISSMFKTLQGRVSSSSNVSSSTTAHHDHHRQHQSQQLMRSSVGTDDSGDSNHRHSTDNVASFQQRRALVGRVSINEEDEDQEDERGEGDEEGEGEDVGAEGMEGVDEGGEEGEEGADVDTSVSEVGQRKDEINALLDAYHDKPHSAPNSPLPGTAHANPSAADKARGLSPMRNFTRFLTG